MHIVIAGSGDITDEIKRKFGYAHEYTLEKKHPVTPADLLFDLMPEEGIRHYPDYLKAGDTLIFTHSLYYNLSSLIKGEIAGSGRVFGFCGWPTFIDRKLLEVTSFNDKKEKIDEICRNLGTAYRLVSDRVGMVTPRIVAMIINEAYYTVQEGTAKKEDIDKAMKLGTNYPYGPFEWATRIGLENIYRLLNELYKDTREERYKICPMLKKEFDLKNEQV